MQATTETVGLTRGRLPSRRWQLLAALCALSLLAASGPTASPSSVEKLPGPPAGTKVQLAVEGGAYHFVSGCSGPHQYVGYTAAQASVRRRTRAGWTLAAEGYVRRGKVTRSVPRPEPDASQVSTVGKRVDGYAVAARFGFHGRYGGIELGPGFGTGLASNDNQYTTLLPSGTAWLGRYGKVQVWTSVFAEPTFGANRSLGVGIGHESERVRVKVGMTNSSGEDGSFLVDGDFALGEGLWLGGGGQLGNANTYSAFARVGYSFPTAVGNSGATSVQRRVPRHVPRAMRHRGKR